MFFSKLLAEFKIKFKLENILHGDSYNDIFKIYLSSALLNIFDDSKYMQCLLKLLINSTEIDRYNRFFAYYQCVRYSFTNSNMGKESVIDSLKLLYDKVFEEFSLLSKEYVRVTKNERNEKLIFVITSQFLNLNHSPTKLALDVCYNLVKSFDKNVVLINTEEVLTLKGLIPLSNITSPSVLKGGSNISNIEYKDMNIPFYQPEVSMPDVTEIVNILNMLEKYKPNLVINIGTTLIGDLCTKVIPSVTIPLGVNDYSKSTFHVIYDKNECVKYMEKNKRSIESLIVSKFQFELKPQHHIFTKEQLGIPKDKFIIAVVGGRLNQEVDKDFLDVLEISCQNNNVYIVFISEYKFNEKESEEYKYLVKNYKNMGYQNDLSAVLENVDIYVNPYRIGGGTSAIYAMYLGKPVITLNYGDVAVNVGNQFIVKSYDEMKNIIWKYINDAKFYKSQSCIAKKMGLGMVDSNEFIRTIYEKATMSPLF